MKIISFLQIIFIFLFYTVFASDLIDSKPGSYSYFALTSFNNKIWTVGENFLDCWDYKSSEKENILTNPEDWFQDILFLDDGQGIIAGRAGSVYYSPDSGKNWIPRHPTVDENLHRICLTNDSKVYFGCSNGLIISSTDFGKTWIQQNTKTNVVIRDIFFLDSTGWAVGDFGTLLYTQDGGTSWEKQKLSTAINMHGVLLIDSTKGFIWGDCGTIFYTKTGGKNWKLLRSPITESIRDFEYLRDGWFIAVGRKNLICLFQMEADSIETELKICKFRNISSNYINAFISTDLYDAVYNDIMDEILICGSKGALFKINLKKAVQDSEQTLFISDIDTLQLLSELKSRSELFEENFRSFIDQPYFLNPLGEGLSGKIDKDPRFDFSRFDCQTAVEHALAGALIEHRDARILRILDQIRYQSAKVSFWTRNHFFVPDWIPFNSWIVEDVTTNIGDTLSREITRTIGRQQFLGYYDIKNPHIKDQVFSTFIIPLEYIELIQARIEDNMIVSFVGRKPKTEWLFTVHIGSLYREQNNIYLRHASSTAKKVINEDFFDYIKRGSQRLLGIKLLRIID